MAEKAEPNQKPHKKAAVDAGASAPEPGEPAAPTPDASAEVPPAAPVAPRRGRGALVALVTGAAVMAIAGSAFAGYQFASATQPLNLELAPVSATEANEAADGAADDPAHDELLTPGERLDQRLARACADLPAMSEDRSMREGGESHPNPNRGD